MAEINLDNQPAKLYPSGLGGWLVLVQIGLYATLLIQVVLFFQNTLPSLNSEIWNLFTSPDSQYYDSMWAPTLIFETIANLSIILFVPVLLIYFYRKKRMLPLLIKLFYVSATLITVADYFLIEQITLPADVEVDNSLRDTIRSGIACVIWVWYFTRSERVRNTFVK